MLNGIFKQKWRKCDFQAELILNQIHILLIAFKILTLNCLEFWFYFDEL